VPDLASIAARPNMARPPPNPSSPQWLNQPPAVNAPYVSAVRNSPGDGPRPRQTPEAMYNPHPARPTYPPYHYSGPSDDIAPGWGQPSYVPDGQYQQNWYMQQHGPSSTNNGYPQPPLLPAQDYPPSSSIFQPPPQDGPYRSSYTPPPDNNVSPERTEAPPSASGFKREKSSSGPKKKRKKVMAENEGTASGGSPNGDGDKEKRMKTGRACDACVSCRLKVLAEYRRGPKRYDATSSHRIRPIPAKLSLSVLIASSTSWSARSSCRLPKHASKGEKLQACSEFALSADT